MQINKVTPGSPYAKQLFSQQGGKCKLSGRPLVLGVNAVLCKISAKNGFVEGNVRWLDYDTKKIKGRLSDEELLYWCRKVAEFRR